MDLPDLVNERKEVMDIRTICRFCLVEKENLCSLYLEGDEIKEKVYFCTGIQIQLDDRKPPHICQECTMKLTIAYEFKKTCLMAEEWLLQHLLQDVKQDVKCEFKEESCYADDDEHEYISDDDVKEDILEEILKTSLPISIDFKAKSKVGNQQNKISKLEKKTRRKKEIKVNNSNSKEQPVKVRKFRRLYCEVCNVKFESGKKSKEHRKLHKKSWICEVCGKSLSSHGSLLTHIQSHHSASRFCCDHCPYSTGYKYDLVKHIKTHGVRKRSFQCRECTSSYLHSYHLNAHIARAHRHIRKFVCPTCDKRFAENSKLKRHMDSHSDVRRFVNSRKGGKCARVSEQCGGCGAGGLARFNCKRYSCDECHAQFARRCTWKKHLESKHGIVPPKAPTGRRNVNCILP